MDECLFNFYIYMYHFIIKLKVRFTERVSELSQVSQLPTFLFFKTKVLKSITC